MMVKRSDLQQSPGELILGKAGIDSLLRRHDAHNVFDEMSPLDVVWDDGLMHGLDCQEELVQQEVLFDECLNVDSTAVVDLLTLLTHGNETFHKEVDMEAANNLFSSVQHEVVWDEEMPSDIGTHESVVLTPVRTSGLLKQCINAADQVFGDFPSKVVVWDEELFHDLDSNDGLLQQLALGGECGNGEKMICIPIAPGNRWSDPFSDFESVKQDMTAQIDNVVTDVDLVKHEDAAGSQVSACALSETDVREIRQETTDAYEVLTEKTCQEDDTQQLVEQVVSGVTSVSKGPAHVLFDEIFPLKYELGTTGAQVLRSKLRESVLEIRKEIFAACDMLTEMPCKRRTNQILAQSHDIFSPRKYKLELCMMPERQWDPGISEYVTRRPFLAGILLHELKAYALYANGHMDFLLEFFYKSCWNSSCSNTIESAQLEIYMATLIQWDLGPVEWYKSNYLCTADTRLVESGIDSSLSTQSVMLNDSLFFDMKYYLHLQSRRYIFMVHFLCSSRSCMPAVAWGQATFCGGGNDVWQCMLQSRCKMEMHATVLGANDLLQHISACSLFLQLGHGKLYRVLTSGDGSSQFLKPGIYVTSQMFVEILGPLFFCSSAQIFAAEELYNILDQVDELLLFPDKKLGRPWCDIDLICDPIMSWRCNGFSPRKWLLQLKPYIVRQWDTGISGIFSHRDTIHGHAVAWGQATFCGGGNVTPMDSKVSKTLADKWATHPWDPGRTSDGCISSWSMNAEGRKENREEIVVFFLEKDGLGEIIVLSRSSRPGPHHPWPRGVTPSPQWRPFFSSTPPSAARPAQS